MEVRLRQYTKSRTMELNQSAALLNGILALPVVAMALFLPVVPPLGAVALRADALCSEPLGSEALSADSLGAVAAAFGVLGGFQVVDFDVFLVFHCLALLFWIGSCLCYVSGTEQQLTPANDILLGDQIVQTDQFFFLALLPSM
jgi:hypothetical protein